MKKQLTASIVISLVLGYAQFAMLVFLWSFIARYSPLVKWCVAIGLHRASIHAVVYVADLLTNIVLSLPAAWVLVILRPPKLALYLALAVLPVFLLTNAPLFFDHVFSTMVLLAWTNELAALPIAAYLLRTLMKPGSPARASQDNVRIAGT